MKMIQIKKKLSQELVVCAIIAGLIAGRIVNPFFFVGNNISVILYACSIYGMLAVAESLVLLVGEIDLTIGISAVVSPALASYLGNAICKAATGKEAIRGGYVMVPWWLIVVLTLAIAAMIGVMNAILVVKCNVPAFVATIGMQYAITGIGYMITKGTPLFMSRVKYSDFIGGKKILNMIPVCFFLFLAVAVIFVYLCSSTKFGMRIYATGGNVKSAKLCGINTDLWKMLMYIISGLLSGITGVVFTSKLQSIDVTQTTGYEMTALAIAIIAGIELSGGVGKISNTLQAALFMAVLSNVMSSMGFLSYHQTFVTGMFIVLFAIIHKMRDSKRLRELDIVEV